MGSTHGPILKHAYLQHIAEVLVLFEPLQRGMTKPLVGLRGDHEWLEVAVVEACVVGARVEPGLLLAALNALVHHTAHAQQCHLWAQGKGRVRFWTPGEAWGVIIYRQRSSMPTAWSNLPNISNLMPPFLCPSIHQSFMRLALLSLLYGQPLLKLYIWSCRSRKRKRGWTKAALPFLSCCAWGHVCGQIYP